jgi:hypothetical protein
MSNDLEKVENKITEFLVSFIKTTLYFLTGNQQSFVISFIHYVVFIIGFYYFFFQSEPKSIFRIIFFFVVLLGALSYFTFNRCTFTSIEFDLSEKKNPIQKVVDVFFGKEIEGNISSKIVLSLCSILLGTILLKDYGYIKISNN